MSNNRICYKCGESFYYPDGREHICTGIPVQPSTPPAHPAPTCPYCGMNMKSGDGSWWCTDKTCHDWLYPNGIAQTTTTCNCPLINDGLSPNYWTEHKPDCPAGLGTKSAQTGALPTIPYTAPATAFVTGMTVGAAAQTGEAKPVQPWMEAAIKELNCAIPHEEGNDPLGDRAAQIIAAHAPSSSASAGWIVASETGLGLKFRTMEQGQIMWTLDRENALRFARREDAEKFAAEDEDAWKILPVSSGSASEYEMLIAMQRQINALEKFRAFAVSTIKSGEPWTNTCEQMFKETLGE